MEEPEYIKKLRELSFNRNLSTPARIARVDTEKGTIVINKKAFEDWENTPTGRAQRAFMVNLDIDHFDYWMYNKKLHRKQKIKFVVEFIEWLEKKIERQRVDEKLSVYGHLWSAKVMEIKHSFRYRLFWYKIYLGLKIFFTKELKHFQLFFNFKPHNGNKQ